MGRNFNSAVSLAYELYIPEKYLCYFLFVNGQCSLCCWSAVKTKQCMSYKIIDFLSLLLTSWVTTGLFRANNLHRKMDSEHACMFLFVCFERFF